MENQDHDSQANDSPNELPTAGDLVRARLTSILAITPEQEAERAARELAEEAEARKRRRSERLREFLDSIGKLHAQCRLHNFDMKRPEQQAVVSALKEYSQTMDDRIKNMEGLVFFGPVGTGKDHLAVSMAGIAVEHHDQRAMLTNVQDWFGEIRDAMDSDAERAERSLIRELSTPDILILSDPLPPMGALGQHMATMLYRLVEQRDSLGRMTWVTVNVSNDKEADERFGSATWDRLCHRSWKIRCAWPSYRKPAKTINC